LYTKLLTDATLFDALLAIDHESAATADDDVGEHAP
jgi:hypothetical protein